MAVESWGRGVSIVTAREAESWQLGKMEAQVGLMGEQCDLGKSASYLAEPQNTRLKVSPNQP